MKKIIARKPVRRLLSYASDKKITESIESLQKYQGSVTTASAGYTISAVAAGSFTAMMQNTAMSLGDIKNDLLSDIKIKYKATVGGDLGKNFEFEAQSQPDNIPWMSKELKLGVDSNKSNDGVNFTWIYNLTNILPKTVLLENFIENFDWDFADSTVGADLGKYQTSSKFGIESNRENILEVSEIKEFRLLRENSTVGYELADTFEHTNQSENLFSNLGDEVFFFEYENTEQYKKKLKR